MCVNASHDVAPVHSDGYTLTLTYINCNVMLDLQSNRTSFNLNLSGQVLAPEQSRTVAISSQFEVFEAIDESNRDLIPKQQRMAMRNNPQPRNYQAVMKDENGKPMPGWFQISLNPQNTPMMIQKLRGQVLAMVAKTVATKEFKPVRGSKDFQEVAPGMEIRIEGDEKIDGSFKMEYRNKGPRDAKWGWGVGPPFLDSPDLTDQEGKKIDASVLPQRINNGPEGVSGEILIQLRPKAGQKLTSLKVNVITEVVEKPIPFEIKDLVLPTAGPIAPHA